MQYIRLLEGPIDEGLVPARLGSARDVYRGLFPPTHPAMPMVGCAIGVVLVAEGRVQEATPLVRGDCPRYQRMGLANPTVVRWAREAEGRLRP